jgi:hypothetical protein
VRRAFEAQLSRELETVLENDEPPIDVGFGSTLCRSRRLR